MKKDFCGCLNAPLIFKTAKFLKHLMVLVLLSHGSINHSQRASALAAFTPNGTVLFDQEGSDNVLHVLPYN